MAKRLAGSGTSKATKTSEKASDTKPRRRAKATVFEPSDDDVRTRAYHLFLERGGGPDQALDDWVAAEKELRQQG